MIALQTAVADARASRTVPRNPPAYNPQSNGSAEKAVQDVAGQMRRLTSALEVWLQLRISAKLPLMIWLVRHTAWGLTHFQVGHDGFTAWRRLSGRPWKGTVAEFGKHVISKLIKKKRISAEKA